ncbi:MAG: 5-formyltetrahydrofolate cyclo-ligase [Holophagaceae bacterium]|nr:5-formyltetrahydrofolate cyclo-ligase [Holophagaceae bacterium]
METKAEVRAHLKARREALPEGERAAWSKAVAGHLDRLCRDRGFHRIGAFWPFGAEVDLRPAITTHPDWLWFFPRVASTHPPRLVWGTEPLERGPWGLMEPSLAQHFLPPVQLLLVPGLAFDDDGYRMGYGRGFYDALLAKLPDEVLTVGVGFEAQMRLPVPVEPHDWPVQALLSERGFRMLTPDD